MPSDKHCCVPGCKDSGGMHKVLHGFPNPDKDLIRFNIWLNTIGGELLNLEKYHIYKYRRVCHSHFEVKYLCRNDRVSNIAVPTLCLIPDCSRKPRSPLAERNQMLQIPDMIIASTSLVSSKKASIPIAERNPMLQIPDVTKASTSSDPSYRQYLGVKASQILENMHTAAKENIAPASSNTQSEMDIDTLSSDQLTLKKQIVTKKTDVEGNNTAQPSSLVTVSLMDVQQKQEKTAKKKIRRLHMTHAEKELLGKLTSTRVKLSKCRSKLKKQFIELKAAKNITTNPSFLKMLENSTSTAKLLIQMEIRENKKKEKGRRFTIQEKIASLAILKQSAKAYRNLRKIFALPAPQTLHKLIRTCNLHAGINKNIFSQLKKKAKLMTQEEKLCILLFDEISIQANLTYQERRDQMTGFVDNGETRQLEFADHAQVFMLRGLIKNFKQPVAYTFAASATKGPELAKQIKNIIHEVQHTGLTVVAMVCDQGSNNRSAIKILLNETRGVCLREGKEPKDNLILVNNQEIVPLYDPPHLLKGIRNNLLTKNLRFEKEGEIKIAKWKHLHLLYKENPGYKGIRLMPKLTANHVQADKMNKMKVKYASQVFSRTIASNMGYLADKGILPNECKDTADLLLLVDNLFDSVNGSFEKKKKIHAKPLLGPATPNSQHHMTWEESKKVLKSMKYINSSGKEESVPTIQNWVWTLEGIKVLLKKLQTEFQVTSVWMRHLNQDPLENFFGSIRSQGCRNNNPTSSQFESSFSTLLINNLTSVYNRGKNCEQDFCEALHALVIEENIETSSTCDTYDFENLFSFNHTSIEDKTNDPRKIAPLQYISGYFVKKVKTAIFKNCEECNLQFITDDEIEYIKYREYAGRRWLITPSNDMIKLISEMQDIINEIVKESLEEKNLRVIIRTAMFTLVDFGFIKCDIHRDKLIDYLINIVFKCFIFNYCKIINQILTGKREIDDDEDKFQVKAKKYNKKCYKRKK